MYRQYNPNPHGARVGDCTVRAITCATDQTWDETYIYLCLYGLITGDMPSANSVWGAYLKEKGFHRKVIPCHYPECYTVRTFTKEHPKGTYILALNGHVVAVKDGWYYDSWDSGDEIPIYYWTKGD